MKKNVYIRGVLSAALALVLILSVFASSASAAIAWPSLSSTSYCEMVSPVSLNVYRDSGLTTRGTSSPAKSYNASVAKNDLLYIYSITPLYTALSYPTNSGRRTGFVRTSELFGVGAPLGVVTSVAKVTTYKGASTSAKSGSTAVGDQVYKLGTTGNFILILYTAASGSRSMKAAFVTLSDYAKISGSTDVVAAASAAWQYPMKNAYCTWRSYTDMSWASYTANSSGRNYHLGVDIYGTGGAVYAASAGTVAAVSTSNSGANGRYVIIQHTINGKTVYSFYAHLASVKVSKGQAVTCDTQIGVAGGSGYGSNSYYGTHLHFAIVDTLWSNGRYYGYSTYFSGNKHTYGGVTYYSPVYVVSNGKLP